MHIGIKSVNKNSEKNYSSMTSEERLNLKRKIIQDAINFSYNFSYSNFVNYQYLSQMYASSSDELTKLEKIIREIKMDDNKKKEMIKIARQKIPLSYFPINNMYSEGELKYFENCLMPYVNKQEDIKQIQKFLYDAYQNYVIYNNICELWTEQLDSLNKLILFDSYINKPQIDPMHVEKQEKIHINKIEKIKRRIRMHIHKDNEVPNETMENKQYYETKSGRTKKENTNFDDWL
ncbi:hypothetical protein, conserved [Plasmodium gonderi]|uniref:Uncharacterized protein n=1 Tax=Plasmodium gonderi TaxID=77519 RepID=A0A1Y1JN66_PLAGO|nr:hypothetical protein, conserved [Plasmodium gonderi]GAW82677.1 hypothetical protein, conserved [Plasmodium gonderi]